MTDVSLYGAIRIIVRTLPGGDELAEKMTDAWIKRGGAAVEPENPAVLGSYQQAVAGLKQAFQSSDVNVSVVDAGAWRPIADHERRFRIDIREAMLVRSPLPPLREILICAADLRRIAPKIVKAPNTGPAEARAIADLAATLATEPQITKADAKARISQHPFSDQGFDDRIWPAARMKAGLDPKGKPGRKPR